MGDDGGVSRFSSDGLAVWSSVWGVVGEQEEVHRIDLETVDGFGASFATYGATLLSVRSGDKTGNIEEVTLQYDTLEGVVSGDYYYGATIGRVCNRIAGAEFSAVNGTTYTLDKNNGNNCLHGGAAGFDKVIWRHEIFHKANSVGVRFEYDSPDGEGGFPGAVAFKITYSITRGSSPGTGALHSDMEAKYVRRDRPARSDQTGSVVKSAGDTTPKEIPTPVNLTNHAYWNLSGGRKRLVRDHGLFTPCDRFLPLDENQIPTGELASVRGTFLDFSEERLIGDAIDGMGGDPPGLDHCLVANGTSTGGSPKVSLEDGGGRGSGSDSDLPLLARLREAESGRVVEVFGSQPSVQVYTANYLSKDPAEAPHVQHNAVCLETQHFPDAVNCPAWANSVLLEPGGIYRERAQHVFSAYTA